MRSFFKIFFASLLALVVFVILFVVVTIGIISSAAKPGKPDLGAKGVLVLDLSNTFNEHNSPNPLGSLTGNASTDAPGLYEVVRLLHYAKTDSTIKGLYVKASDNPNGFATSEELIKAIQDFKQSKKFVMAYGETISEKAYYIACEANKIYCHPIGDVEWDGFAVNLFFIKNLLNKLEIQPQIFYAGKFKSATEPLRATEMTEPNKLQTNVWLGDLYSLFLQQASQARHIDTAQLHSLAVTGAIQSSADAVRNRLIDGVKYDNDIKSEWHGILHLKEKENINFIPLSKYAEAVDYTKVSGSRIAVLYAEGSIVDGKEQRNQIASEQYKDLIRKLRLDDEIKAIVFRVNSPGGSALASDVIWHEIRLARQAKPVVVSMGDYAASGGYYISCGADSIFTNKGTLTGSIGVFSVIPNMKSFYNDKLGITFDGVKTAPYADMMTTSRPLSPVEQQFVQNSIDTIYTTFVQRVASGRNKDTAYINSIAQGRVWTGMRGVSVGIADKTGTLQNAVDCAARMAKTSDFYIKEYPEPKSYWEELLDMYDNAGASDQAIESQLGKPAYRIFTKLKSVQDMFSIPQAKLPFLMELQ